MITTTGSRATLPALHRRHVRSPLVSNRLVDQGTASCTMLPVTHICRRKEIVESLSAPPVGISYAGFLAMGVGNSGIPSIGGRPQISGNCGQGCDVGNMSGGV